MNFLQTFSKDRRSFTGSFPIFLQQTICPTLIDPNQIKSIAEDYMDPPCPNPIINATLHLEGIHVTYSPTNDFDGSLDAVIQGILGGDGDTVTFPYTPLPNNWYLLDGSYSISAKKLLSLHFENTGIVGWIYPVMSCCCPKTEGMYPTLGSQTLAIDSSLITTGGHLWYDENSSYDTNPGLPGCDTGPNYNTVRTSEGRIYVTETVICN